VKSAVSDVIGARHSVEYDRGDFGETTNARRGELIESRLSRYGIEPLLLIADQIRTNLIAQGWFDPQHATH
jgi:hypothetical protein